MVGGGGGGTGIPPCGVGGGFGGIGTPGVERDETSAAAAPTTPVGVDGSCLPRPLIAALNCSSKL